MWIVRIALRRPLTFIALSLVIVLLGLFTLSRTAVDIFPSIRIPIVATIWYYSGLPPEEMASRIVLGTERNAQTTVTNVEHTESQSLNGMSVVKAFFQPNVNEDLAYAQIAAVSQAQLRQMPPGTNPPFVLAYDASTVPVLQLAFSSPSLSEAEINDLALTTVRAGLSTVRGAALPYPYGGRQRQVQVDLDPQALRANGLAAMDVSNAIAAQNLIIPAGTQKIGSTEYFVKLNAGTRTVEELNELPVGNLHGNVLRVRDVAHVRDGSAPQTNVVRLGGHRAVLMNVLKTGNASTLEVISGVHRRIEELRAGLPADLSIKAIGDQSLFVRAAVQGVIREGLIAAALTALMILLFLGSWRSTLIITISIPLAALTSIICLSALGETMNIMTLGGLALAVGILVDDATVTIENINTHLEMGKEVEPAIMDGAHEIALPAFVSTLAICIVFIPMFYLSGIAKFLFVPLAEAVVFAMLASYLLSRTLVPTLARYWLTHEHASQSGSPHLLARWQRAFEHRFEQLRELYRGWLTRAIGAGPRFAALFLLAMAASALLAFPLGPLPGLGQDFFPSVDAGQIKLHLRGPTGMRIEETAALADRVEASIREVIPATQLSSIADNIGVPYSGINLSYSTSLPVGPSDADVFISLNQGHSPTAEHIARLRDTLRTRFPGVDFSFLPADIVNQILNFGVPVPIDIQIAGMNVEANRRFAAALVQRVQRVPGAIDVHVHQAFDYPQLKVSVDRTRAQQLGLTQQAIASNLLVSLSGSFQTQPSYWLDTKSGNQYSVVVQTPQYRLDTLDDLKLTPVSSNSATGATPQVLGNVASFSRGVAPAVVSHYDARPVIDVFASVAGTDLGFVASKVRGIVQQLSAQLPRGSTVSIRGQAETMTGSFNGLLLGLLGAVILVYLLIVINFQSWLDPFIIITGLPAALAGIVWMLFLTHTTVSVPALIGAIMCMGVAT
ncbi:MAG: efflux RND transporter permease subunit, partial [Proteobacteria bacterium]|nr:efflux RND transporter permease subunit [Pseudomonadota bacterium]